MRELCNTPNVFIVAHGSLAVLSASYIDHESNEDHTKHDYISDDDEEEEGDEECPFIKRYSFIFGWLPEIEESRIILVYASYIDHESNEDHTKHYNISDDDEEEEGDEECPLIKLSAEEKKPIREPCRQTLTVKVTGRKTGYTYLMKRLQTLENPGRFRASRFGERLLLGQVFRF
ncbi:hypothetical protein NC653_028540 [Populus alba x Populus x berolinensis]|uniref:Uncharacterized protein n=1 Tax=Populus alba x Populus x berolinensis TaxID=444605 RepID=A0AAD6M145_9ROSI|nr:hypothetical protein NC653_028540 [Populus alba x Populus x berolinensis]